MVPISAGATRASRIPAVPDSLRLLVLFGAWPVLTAYAGYRLALVIGPIRHERAVEVSIAAIGAVIAWVARVAYAFGVPVDWPFALTILACALMLAPKLVGVANRQ